MYKKHFSKIYHLVINLIQTSVKFYMNIMVIVANSTKKNIRPSAKLGCAPLACLLNIPFEKWMGFMNGPHIRKLAMNE